MKSLGVLVLGATAGPDVAPKAAVLSRLLHAGLPVPPGLVLRPDELAHPAVRCRLDTLLAGGSVIVRAALAREDSPDAAAAGLGLSVPDCRDRDDVERATAEIAAAARDPWLLRYSGGPPEYHVLVQRQVERRWLAVVAADRGGAPLLELHGAARADALAAGATPAWSGPLALAGWLGPRITGLLEHVASVMSEVTAFDLELVLDPSGSLWLVQARPLARPLTPGWEEFRAAVAPSRDRIPDLPGLWRLDAEHNPAALSPAHAGIITWLIGQGARLRVLGGWLYEPARPAPLALEPFATAEPSRAVLGPSATAEPHHSPEPPAPAEPHATTLAPPKPSVTEPCSATLEQREPPEPPAPAEPHAATLESSVADPRSATLEQREPPATATPTPDSATREQPASLAPREPPATPTPASATTDPRRALAELRERHLPAARRVLAEFITNLGGDLRPLLARALEHLRDTLERHAAVRVELPRDLPGLDPRAPMSLRERGDYLDVLPAAWDIASPALADLVDPTGLMGHTDHTSAGDESLERAAVLVRELDDHLFALALAPLRRVYLAAGARLGLGDDVFLLAPDELSDLLAGRAGPDLDARRRQQQRLSSLRPPLALHDGRPVPLSPRRRLFGLPVGPGARGRIAQRRDLEDLLARPPAAGAVVVLPALTAQAAVALQALAVRAVCCEYGGALSHATLMARELGLSALIGCSGCSELPDGLEVELDTRVGRLIPSDMS